MVARRRAPRAANQESGSVAVGETMRKLTIVTTFAAALALGLAAVSGSAQARDPEGRYAVFGTGSMACWEWIDAWRGTQASTARLNQWVMGFITAFNAFQHSGQNVLEGQDPGVAIQWIDTYCHENNDANVAEAAVKYMELLQSMR
jgi:hypothetical protein